jgi:ATP-dependent Clp protease ATP-binding subunit ClpC
MSRGLLPQEMPMFERLTDRARRVVVLAQEEARMLNHNYIGTEHLLLGLIHENEGVAAQALEALGIGLDPVRRQVEEIIGQGQQAPSGHIPFTPRAKRVLELSLREALQLGHNYIGTEHILLALIREGEGVAAQVLVAMGADLDLARQTVIQLLHGFRVPSPRRIRDLTATVSSLGPVIGRDREIEEVVRVLSGDPPGNPLLVGEHGVGTSSVVHGVARAIAGQAAQGRPAGPSIRELNLANLLNGRRPPSNEEASNMFDEMRKERDTVFFIDGARTPIQAVGQVTYAADVLRPVLFTGEVRVIATATPTERDEWSATADQLYDLFSPIAVDELSEEVSAQVLAALREQYHARLGLAITDAAITAAVTLSAQYLPGERLPGKAISLIDRAAARASRRSTVNPADLTRQIAQAQERKDAAIDAGDFPSATRHRDYERALLAQEEAWQAEWTTTPAHWTRAVTAEDVAQALAQAADRLRSR